MRLDSAPRAMASVCAASHFNELLAFCLNWEAHGKLESDFERHSRTGESRAGFLLPPPGQMRRLRETLHGPPQELVL
jgi:hypothetical protein